MSLLHKTFFICITVLTLTACSSDGGGDAGGTTGGGTISGTTTLNVSAGHAPSSYTINTLDNPAITLQRNVTYTFNLSTTGHPFYIMSVQGTNTANAYTNGVTGNGNSTGTLTFTVPVSAPNTLYYNCSIHSGMTGVITITN